MHKSTSSIPAPLAYIENPRKRHSEPRVGGIVPPIDQLICIFFNAYVNRKPAKI